MRRSGNLTRLPNEVISKIKKSFINQAGHKKTMKKRGKRSKSRKRYKNPKYHTRKPLKPFQSKTIRKV